MVEPDVSFVIASYNASAFLADAVRSALAQRRVVVEVLIVDDGSTDGSRTLAQELAAGDGRVRTLRTPRNLGPGGARNMGIDAARGRWIAVLDSDDLIHPDRSRRLIAEAAASGATMIADDLLLFDDGGRGEPSLFLPARRAAAPAWVTLSDYLDETRMFGRAPNLGFLKPMIAADALRASGVRYDDRLRIAEDDALVIALLRAGLRYRLVPSPLYFYRKHGSSISHRLSVADVSRMRDAGDRLRQELASDPVLARALRPRDRALTRAVAFTHLVEALKARRVGAAAGLLVRHPGILPMLRMPLGGGLRKIVARVRPPAPAPRADPDGVLFVSRQRLIGATNGSSAYLLAIAAAVRDTGRTPHLLQPSSVVFGRTPFYRLLPEMSVFGTVRVDGAWRVGDRLIARDPAIWRAAALGALGGLLRRAGIRHRLAEDRPLPPSISRPWTRDALLSVARHARARPGAVIVDYAYQAEALPYLLAPAVPSAIVMHDLIHTRADQFAPGDDTVATLDAAQEIAMLGAADAVLAIQTDEAAFVADHVPATAAIRVPMPATGVAAPQPGADDALLFVGSNTAPNVIGLRWFLDAVWPLIRAARPAARLDVAGTVARAFDTAVPGVRFLGLVDDLGALYGEAGVVVSPLQQGSGLKIKLVEAVAHGKACVVTPTTLQGVERELADAVIRADTAEAFAAGVLSLIDRREARLALGTCALDTARRHFGPDAAMAGLRRWLDENMGLPAQRH